MLPTDRADTIYIERTTRDTVYFTETISRIDTVRELITERIYTYDTVYVNETITLEGDVDTLYVNRTVTTRDTVYNITEHTEYLVSVNSVYLVGGTYAEDSELILSVDDMEIRSLAAYPNPAETTVVIRSHHQARALLRIYDTLGKVVNEFALSNGAHETTVDVSDYDPGAYLFMLINDRQRSGTKRLIVK